jgi:aminopeptidase N
MIERSGKIYLLLVLLLCGLFSRAQSARTIPVQKGVSLDLALHRRAVLSEVRYNLELNIPAVKSEAVSGSETISFRLKKDGAPLQLDFREEADHVTSITVNGTGVPVVLQDEHILLDQQYLKEGINSVLIRFTAGDLSLNRNNDFLYTLLVPDRARTVFPCFDQPDIKAVFRLSLTIPKNWKAMTNAPLLDSMEHEQNCTYHYGESDRFSTYLFSFVAGRFDKAVKTRGGRTMEFFYRETDSNKIRSSVDTIFGLHARALHYLEAYTQIPFPYRKFDFVALPDFQYGGMEHVGAIDYKAATLFLDSGATKDQENARSGLIAHETAHMWFGDLVTMRWFNDVWMKEVFANFMADKITQGSAGNYELKFLITHMPRAYAVDRTAGANPIRQELENLQEAGTLYGAIIYDKAPVMMRQLERLMGDSAFRDGIRDYLKKYSFDNATWPDLISILDERKPADLQAWNKVWVNTPGRPLIRYAMEQKNRVITRFVITQKGEQKENYVLPQFFEMAFVYPGHVEEYTVNMNAAEVRVRSAEGKPVPLYVLFNSSGQGYGLFPADKKMDVSQLKLPLMRAAAYINLYENMLGGTSITPYNLMQELLAIISRGGEPEELNLNLATGYLADIYWRLLTPQKRTDVAVEVEDVLWKAMQKETLPNKKKILFRTWQSIALSKKSLDTLYRIWKDQRAPSGVRLSEDEYISMALNLMVRNYPDAEIGAVQLARTSNTDRKQRLQFLLPAVSADVQERNLFFASLKELKVRKKEAWVADALSYLHHPLHAATSINYLKESLELLEEIQRTGDIFFPGAWLGATLGSYQSTQAAGIVRQFLKDHPRYNARLKAKILQAADPLFRAEKLVRRDQ